MIRPKKHSTLIFAFQVHFPAVTLCNANQFQKSFLTSLGIYDDLGLSLNFAEEYFAGTQKTLSATESREIREIVNNEAYKKMVDEYLYGKRKKQQEWNRKIRLPAIGKKCHMQDYFIWRTISLFNKEFS